MPSTTQSSRLGLFARLVGIVTTPGRAMAEAAGSPLGDVLGAWIVILTVWAAAGGAVLSTPVGRQALVDERVRVTEALGGEVSDATYREWQAHPPFATYFSSGGRTLLVPVVTLLVATGLWLGLGRAEGRPVAFLGCLSVAVHATAVLALQQVLAAPLHLARESLTSPFNLAAVLPLFDEGSPAARFLGTVEVFGLWWVVLLAVGCGAVTGQRARTYLGPLVGVYASVAAVVAATVVLMGGA
jgi:hypothetical protein